MPRSRTQRSRQFSSFFWVLGLALTLLMTLSRLASADPSAADRATARDLAREGFEALKRDDFQTAEDRFRRADSLVHAPTLVVDHARALVGLGRLVEAHERYSLVLREGVSPNAAWPWKRAYADAQKEIDLIKPRLAWLTIKVVGPSAPEVSIDDKPIPAAAVGVRRATDPGERHVTIGGPGFESKTETVVLGEGDEQTLEVELVALPEAPKTEEPEPEPEPEAEPQKQGPETKPRDNTLAYVALGVGGAGLVTWGVTGALLLKQNSTLSENCPNNSCDDSEADSVSTYNTLGWVSGVAAGIGLAGAGAGLYLLLRPESKPADPGAARVAPYFTGNAVGVTGQF